MRWASQLGFRALLVAGILIGIQVSPWWAGQARALNTDRPDAAFQDADFHGHDENSDPEANLPYLFAVYIITWAGFFAYVFFMSRRQREMEREIDELKQVLVEQEPSTRGSEGP